MKLFAFFRKKISYFSSLSLSKSTGNLWLSHRVLLSLLLFSLSLPLVGLFFSYRSMKNNCENIESQITKLESKKQLIANIYQKKIRFYEQFGASDSMYLQHYVEPIKLLERDIHLIKNLFKVEDPSEFDEAKKRIEFLSSEENALCFTKSLERSSKDYKEEEWTLKRGVEIDSFDIKKLLSLLEGVSIDDHLPNPFRPQILLKKFMIHQLLEEGMSGVFTLNLEVLQRECHGKNS